MYWNVFFFCTVTISILYYNAILVKTEDTKEKCFCELSGLIDDCLCDIETLEKFNNKKVYPIVSRLIKRDFFRYYKVNLNKPCFLWDGDVGLCGSENCVVKLCSDNELPPGMRSSNGNLIEKSEECSKAQELGNVNSTLSNITMDSLDQWDKYDDEEQNFCDLDDETSVDLSYVDLINNPERYTGYSGPLAWRIWKAIYEENCFPPDSITRKQSNPIFKNLANKADDPRFFFESLSTSQNLQGMCLEKRVFFRAISGLHSSINIHLSSEYLFEDGWGKQYWGPNLEEFQRRFDPDHTNGEGTMRMKNLYFLYLLELRALSKVADYFAGNEINLFTGNLKSDRKTKHLLLELLTLTKDFPMHFDEGILFQDKNSRGLKTEFRERFRNITRIIDCVTCEKCRLWGKLQTQGLGTALKILFTQKADKFHLRRQEVVSLINAFSRLSKSITSLEMFRNMLQPESSHKQEFLKIVDEL